MTNNSSNDDGRPTGPGGPEYFIWLGDSWNSDWSKLNTLRAKVDEAEENYRLLQEECKQLKEEYKKNDKKNEHCELCIKRGFQEIQEIIGSLVKECNENGQKKEKLTDVMLIQEKLTDVMDTISSSFLIAEDEVKEKEEGVMGNLNELFAKRDDEDSHVDD